MPCRARSVRRQRCAQTHLAARVARHGRAVSGDCATASLPPVPALGPSAPALGPLAWLLTTQRPWQAVMVHALAYGAQRILIGQRVRHDRGAGRDCATASLTPAPSAWQSLYSAVATDWPTTQRAG